MEALLTKSGKPPARFRRESEKLVQELQVHQVELEMQNEELRRSQLDLQAARDRYAELYNFSPAGHLTLDRRGVIQEANLQAGTLLGLPRGELIHQPLVKFIVPSEQGVFARHWLDVFHTNSTQSCNLRFLSSAGVPLVLHLECQAYPNETGRLDYCRAALFDITQQQQLGEERDRLAFS